jgi:Fic family protein
VTPNSTRMGQYVRQSGGFRAFVPKPLPPDPPVNIDRRLLLMLSRADQSLARLDGVSITLPNPDLFVAMYVRREAVNSSAIEGTQSTLEDVLAYELHPGVRGLPDDVEEVVNYVRAMNRGLERLASLPLSLRLIREIHGELLENVRGGNKAPGEFRRTQNWIGPAGASLNQATFVPPPVPEMLTALDNLERFLHNTEEYPDLIHAAIAHAQFETIHPFLDGNGRVGRLLITLLLVHRKVLRRPLLYLSHYLKLHRSEYYDRLNAIRVDGNWEGWIEFFLRGVVDTAIEATDTAERIVQMKEQHQQEASGRGFGMNEHRLINLLFQRPLVNVALVQRELGFESHRTATKTIDRLVEVGLLEEITGRKRDRVFRYTPYVELFESDQLEDGYGSVTGVTESLQ